MTEAPYMSEPWFELLLLQVQVKGATQAAIARQLGISAVTLNMVLRGIRHDILVSHLLTFARQQTALVSKRCFVAPINLGDSEKRQGSGNWHVKSLVLFAQRFVLSANREVQCLQSLIAAFSCASSK